MTPATVSVCALVAAIVLSCTSRINVGLIAIPLAWVVGVYAGGLRADAVLAGFPGSLFVTLAGVTLLFALAETNGAVQAAVGRALRAVRGQARLIPILLFVIAAAVSSIGPGAIASTALVVPLGMAIGQRAGVPPLLTALMVANGANAGNLSPFSAIGVIANTKMREAGIGGHELAVWFANFAAHVAVGVAAYLLFGGWRLSGSSEGGDTPRPGPTTGAQRLTLAVIAAWIVSVALIELPIGLSAFAAAIVLIALRASDEGAAIGRMPWGIILMVCGVSVLIAVVEKTGGLTLFMQVLARLASPATVNGVVAFVTGLISIYSSTSGVVLPTFLPLAPSLVRELGGGDPVAVALSINVGSSLVDVSPLSTLGALAVAAATDPHEGRRLFRALLIWGLSMALVGAVWSQVLSGSLSRL